MTEELNYLDAKFAEFDSLVKKFYPNAENVKVKQTMAKGTYTYLIDGLTLVLSSLFSGERYALELISKEKAKNGKKVTKSTVIKHIKYRRYDDDNYKWEYLPKNFEVSVNALLDAHNSHHFTLVEIRKEDLDLID